MAGVPRLVCASYGESPEGEPCGHYVRGYCRNSAYCPHKSDMDLSALAKKAEHIEIPERIQRLLESVAKGDMSLDAEFVQSTTYRALYAAMEIIDTYDPVADSYVETKLDCVETLETDGMKLAAINTRIGAIQGILQAEVESLEGRIKELEGAKTLRIEETLKQGLRSGVSTDRRVRALVLQDPQINNIKDTLMCAKKRHLVVENICRRVESTINMIKKRADGIMRREFGGRG